jgi:hypothetical protein
MRVPCLIVFAFGCLSTVDAANALLPTSLEKIGPISSAQQIQVAQQGPVKGEPAQRRRQNPQHKKLAHGNEKPSSAPDSDANQTRLAPGS